jgi:hypothetical protein
VLKSLIGVLRRVAVSSAVGGRGCNGRLTAVACGLIDRMRMRTMADGRMRMMPLCGLAATVSPSKKSEIR